jgi:hypothetical protein
MSWVQKPGYVTDGDGNFVVTDGVEFTVQTMSPVMVDYDNNTVTFKLELGPGDEVPELGTAVELKWWRPRDEEDGNAR